MLDIFLFMKHCSVYAFCSQFFDCCDVTDFGPEGNKAGWSAVPAKNNNKCVELCGRPTIYYNIFKFHVPIWIAF